MQNPEDGAPFMGPPPPALTEQSANQTSCFSQTTAGYTPLSLSDLAERLQQLKERHLPGFGNSATPPSSGQASRKLSAPSRTHLLSDQVRAIVNERSMNYGEPIQFYSNLAEAWNAILSQAWGVNMRPGLDCSTVCLMLASLKTLRAATGWKDDNYVDAVAFLSFAQEAQAK
jgi:Domain of unknown function (DUF6378)